MKSCSILICGAGPVGLAVAALLLHGRCGSRFDVRVLEPRPAPSWDREQTDLRVYALSRASQHLFERLGLWDAILSARASPYRRMCVWEGQAPDGIASIGFDSAEVGEPDLGHIVEDTLLRTALLDLLHATGRCDVVFDVAPEALERAGPRITLSAPGGRRMGGDLLVGADGSHSLVRLLGRFPVLSRAYRQKAMVTHVASELPHRETAWQRFLPGGPLAFLPLADGRSSVVWSMPSTDAERLAVAADDEFLAALQVASGGVLGRLGPVSARASFRLQVLHAPRYCAPGIALAGDAAHTVHPLAGQGMNLGLLDAACLAEVIEHALANGEHPGDLRVLRRYERRRKGDNVKMLLALDGLERAFRLPRWLGPARALGLAVVDRTAPAKRALIRRALGLSSGQSVVAAP